MRVVTWIRIVAAAITLLGLILFVVGRMNRTTEVVAALFQVRDGIMFILAGVFLFLAARPLAGLFEDESTQ
ncbi:MAG: hypothetical protein ACYS9X_02300 [Planctomycetota bacterium]